MKLAYSNKDKQEWDFHQPVVALMQIGKRLEQEDPAKAISLYTGMIRLYPNKITLYDRLLIVFRKEKDIKKELQLLNKAISYFRKIHDQAHHRTASKKVTQLSKSIAKLTGMHLPGKTSDMALPQPLAKWIKRKAALLKKH